MTTPAGPPYPAPMRHQKSLLGLGLAITLMGCESASLPHQEYDAPRITGRVVDGVTGQPIPDAAVRRGPLPQAKPVTYGDARGKNPSGAVLVVTDRDGRFVLPSSKSFFLIGSGHGFSTTVNVSGPGYDSLQTNFAKIKYSTDHDRSEPLIEAGALPLQPSLSR